MKSISHIFFDFDWIIADTEDIYIKIWSDILDETWKKYCKTHYINSTDIDNYQQFKKRLILEDTSLENVRLVRKNLFDQYIESWKVNLIENVRLVIDHLKGKYPLYIISNSHPDLVKKILKIHNLENCFKKIYWLTPDRIAKPSPDLYLYAMNDLKLNTNVVLAFEDSITGLTSALNANVHCLAVSNIEKVYNFCSNNHIQIFGDMSELLIFLKDYQL